MWTICEGKEEIENNKKSQISITIYHKCLQLSNMRLLEIQLLRIMFTVSIYLSDTMLMFMLNKNKPEVTDTEE